MRKINRAGEGHSPAPAGRKVNVSNSRRESQLGPKHGREPKEPKEPCEKGRHPILRFIGRTIATLICLGIMAGSLVAVGAVYYVVQATANDGDLLDLDNIQLSQSSVVMANDPDTGAQVEYATLRSSNSHRVWADLEQIPTNLQYAFICTEDKDFYNEPGVNFKRTIGAMVNEYLLPIYSSKQGASTLEQQLIKNLTDDNSASGIEGALRKLREIYRALCLSRSYSKETILEAYLNTISFTGTIQGVQTAANEYFNKDVSELTLWECATIASITKNPTNYNPYTNPENLINRRNFIMYNMWQQGVISEEDYRNAAAQPLTLAEGYVAAEGLTADITDGEGAVLSQPVRGTKVTYVVEDEDKDHPGLVRLVLGEDSFGYLAREHLVTDPKDVVAAKTVYVRTAVNLLDEAGAVPGRLVQKGEALTVTGWQDMDASGAVGRWQVEGGYIRAEYVTMDEPSAKAQYDQEVYQLHAERGVGAAATPRGWTTSPVKRPASRAIPCPAR